MQDSRKKVDRLIELQDLLIHFVEMERLVFLPDRKVKNRKETNVEHSYSLAMAAWFLSSSYPHLNRDLLIRYALIHDLVEIYAGDEMAVGRTKKAEKQKAEREAAALQILVKEWPDFTEMTTLIHEYETKADAESKFVYALDKIMPVLLNLLSEGKTFKAFNFHINELIDSKEDKIPLSPEINELWQAIKKILHSQPTLFNPGKHTS